jgi:hypothetical protein
MKILKYCVLFLFTSLLPGKALAFDVPYQEGIWSASAKGCQLLKPASDGTVNLYQSDIYVRYGLAGLVFLSGKKFVMPGLDCSIDDLSQEVKPQNGNLFQVSMTCDVEGDETKDGYTVMVYNPRELLFFGFSAFSFCGAAQLNNDGSLVMK